MIERSSPGVLLTGRFDPKAKDLAKQLEAFRLELERLQKKAGADALVQSIESVEGAVLVQVLAARSESKAPSGKRATKK